MVTKQTRPHTNTKSKAMRHRVKHIFVPHRDNEYRPQLIRWRGLAIVLAIVVTFQIGYGLMTSGHLEVLGRQSSITDESLLADTNQQREKDGLGDLVENTKLNQAAFLKAEDMFKHDYWAHTSPQGLTPWYWFGQVGYNYQSAGENLAKNYPTADATVAAWMASPMHRANILDATYTDVGFAVVDGVLDGRATTLVVAEYGQPASQGIIASPIFTAPTSAGLADPATYFASTLQSLSPATMIAIGLFIVVGVVALAAHHYRKRLPKAWKTSWRVHHGAYTFLGAFVMIALLIFATGGGQI